ncbi:choice-of-anchor G family protein [Pseudarthrobacter chlorophenolicus]|uniref:choice-of-anchor G family protein n=1 Tax=Pseudarthrobacter chlorophenolicus TaxID=85085 RepID=UPI0005F2E8DE|nr:choice-of-anchor G family protein [Pseudarthrobacter chlorophenolicus]
MKTLLKRTLKDITGRPRRTLLVAAVAAVSLTATTTVTTAAWVDNEWAGGSVGVSSPGDCSTNTLFSGVASARQLSGTVLGTNLNSIAGIEGLTVTNSNGTASPLPVTATKVTDVPDAFINKLPVTALGLNPVTVGLGLGLPVGGLGTYTQWAQAQDSGQTLAAAGLVTDQSGAVDVGGTATGAATAPQAAVISLDKILPASLGGVTLDVGAVASSASVQGCEMVNGWPILADAPGVTRDYGIASLELGANVPTAGTIVTATNAALTGVPTLLDLQSNLIGALNTGVQEALESLGLVRTTTTAAVVGLDFSSVRALLDQPQTHGAVTLNLRTGRLTVDLAKLPGASPLGSGLAPNTPVLLTQFDVTQVQEDVRFLLTQITTRLRAAVDAVTVSATVTASVIALGSTKIEIAGTVGQYRAGTVQPAVTAAGLNLGQLLSSLVGAVLGAVTTSVVAPLSSAVSSLDATLAPTIAMARADAGAILTAVGTLVSIHVNVQPDQLWTGVKPDDVSANPGEYKVSAIRVGLINQPGLLSLSLGTSAAGPVNYRPS